MECPVELVLASGSPRRRELLSSLGWIFTVRIPSVDETFLPEEGPEDAVLRISSLKAAAVASEFPEKWVVAADTVVSLEERILGKPTSREEAFEMLALLNGRTHTVFTGVTIRSSSRRASAVEKTEVLFRELSLDDIASYAASGEGDDKAGAYAIQGLGALLVASIRGDYFNVVGLPLCRLGLMFESLGFSLAEQWRKKK